MPDKKMVVLSESHKMLSKLLETKAGSTYHEISIKQDFCKTV
jgi:hypothetical protein